MPLSKLNKDNYLHHYHIGLIATRYIHQLSPRALLSNGRSVADRLVDEVFEGIKEFSQNKITEEELLRRGFKVGADYHKKTLPGGEIYFENAARETLGLDNNKATFYSYIGALIEGLNKILNQVRLNQVTLPIYHRDELELEKTIETQPEQAGKEMAAAGGNKYLGIRPTAAAEKRIAKTSTKKLLGILASKPGSPFLTSHPTTIASHNWHKITTEEKWIHFDLAEGSEAALQDQHLTKISSFVSRRPFYGKLTMMPELELGASESLNDDGSVSVGSTDASIVKITRLFSFFNALQVKVHVLAYPGERPLKYTVNVWEKMGESYRLLASKKQFRRSFAHAQSTIDVEIGAPTSRELSITVKLESIEPYSSNATKGKQDEISATQFAAEIYGIRDIRAIFLVPPLNIRGGQKATLSTLQGWNLAELGMRKSAITGLSFRNRGSGDSDSRIFGRMGTRKMQLRLPNHRLQHIGGYVSSRFWDGNAGPAAHNHYWLADPTRETDYETLFKHAELHKPPQSI